MAETPFPHLHFNYIGKLKAKYPSRWREESAEVLNIRANPGQHATTLRGVLEGLEQDYHQNEEIRKKQGLPAVKSGAGFLLRLKEGADADALAHALNVELVAETEGGFILVATEDLSFAKIRSVLDLFEAGQSGGGSAVSVLQAFQKPDDHSRLERILTPEVLPLWPFNAGSEYTFDLSIQTAPSLRKVTFQIVRQRKGESDADFGARKRASRDAILAKASDLWSEDAEQRFFELADLVGHYGGKLLSGFSSDPEKPLNNGVRFADSIAVRVKMNGLGFQDVVLNLPHLFEVAVPEELKLIGAAIAKGGDGKPQILAPDKDAPAVCVIDSGIEEAHLWLAPAVDGVASKCFVPGLAENAVQDEVSASGHGTRVAGAILYPLSVPAAGEVKPIAWIQNARVLNNKNCVPENLPPARYLTDVVDHFTTAKKAAKIFNHSIAAAAPCPLHRMTVWAAKMDELSALHDVLFIQAAGNLDGNGDSVTNPSVLSHRKAGRAYPGFLLEGSARIANPAQSMQALTVGAVSGAIFDSDDLKSFGTDPEHPASYSRTGFGMWDAVKPEVVEVGGDQCHEKGKVGQCIPRAEVATELLCATLHGAPAYAKDGVGTSFATPRVTHIAACLQTLFPEASPLLYRALIVQSARWPKWAEESEDRDGTLRHIGFGKPNVLRATQNSEYRVTLITPDAVEIRNNALHLYTVRIPNELRVLASETKIRLEVTLSYSSEPRRTRRSRYGYLRTRLDWRSSGLGEPLEEYRKRELRTEKTQRRYPQPKWTLHYYDGYGEAEETNRDRGTVQKDWAICEPHELASDFAIAVRAHPGWDHRKDEGLAHYCLVVSFEAVGVQVPVYTLVEAAQVPVDIEMQPQVEIRIPGA